MEAANLEGPLLVEVFKSYEEVYACFVGRKFQSFKKLKSNVPASQANKGDLVVQVLL